MISVFQFENRMMIISFILFIFLWKENRNITSKVKDFIIIQKKEWEIDSWRLQLSKLILLLDRLNQANFSNFHIKYHSKRLIEQDESQSRDQNSKDNYS